MDRNHIEAALRDAYARRAANDADGTTRVFSPDAVYRVVGRPEYCSAVATHRGPGIRLALEQMCKTFIADRLHVTSMVIENERAAVMALGHYRFAPTGETFSVELAHFWTFKGGRAVELVEFFDTAYAAHLLGQATGELRRP